MEGVQKISEKTFVSIGVVAVLVTGIWYGAHVDAKADSAISAAQDAKTGNAAVVKLLTSIDERLSRLEGAAGVKEHGR